MHGWIFATAGLYAINITTQMRLRAYLMYFAVLFREPTIFFLPRSKYTDWWSWKFRLQFPLNISSTNFGNPLVDRLIPQTDFYYFGKMTYSYWTSTLSSIYKRIHLQVDFTTLGHACNFVPSASWIPKPICSEIRGLRTLRCHSDKSPYLCRHILFVHEKHFFNRTYDCGD